jgi:hypothetical protein
MSVEQLESAIEALSTEERRRLANWFDDHRHELLPPAPEVESAQEREVLMRLAETDAKLACLEPLEEADLDQMIRDLAHARAQSPPSRKS